MIENNSWNEVDDEFQIILSEIGKIVGNRGKSCFISRAWTRQADHPYDRFARKFANDLALAGVKVILDERDFNYGTNLNVEMDKIHTAEFVCPLFTPVYKESCGFNDRHVTWEMNAITDRLKKSPGFYIPILVDKTAEESIPDPLLSSPDLYADFTRRENYYHSFFSILEKKLLAHFRPPISCGMPIDIEIYRKRLFPTLNKLPTQTGTVTDPVSQPMQQQLFCGAPDLPPFEWSTFCEAKPKTGEMSYLSNLELSFESKPSKEIIKVLISGDAGVGKTQLALAYTRRSMQNNNYDFIHWVKSETPESICQSFRELLESLDIKVEGVIAMKDLKKSVEKVLQKFQKWLLIFDTVPYPNEANAFLPRYEGHLGGHIIMTSRDSFGVEGIQKVISLDVFQEDEAVDYLLKRRSTYANQREDETSREEARILANELGCHPLALSYSASYIAKTRLSFKDYHDRFKVQSIEFVSRFLHFHPSDAVSSIHLNIISNTLDWDSKIFAIRTFAREQCHSYPFTIGMTWNISKQLLKPRALKLFNYFCYFEPDNIPVDLFVGQLGKEFEIEEAVQELVRFNLVKYNDKKKVVSLHRLAQIAGTYENETFFFEKDGSTLSELYLKELLAIWDESWLKNVAIERRLPKHKAHNMYTIYNQSFILLPHSLKIKNYLSTLIKKGWRHSEQTIELLLILSTYGYIAEVLKIAVSDVKLRIFDSQYFDNFFEEDEQINFDDDKRLVLLLEDLEIDLQQYQKLSLVAKDLFSGNTSFGRKAFIVKILNEADARDSLATDLDNLSFLLECCPRSSIDAISEIAKLPTEARSMILNHARKLLRHFDFISEIQFIQLIKSLSCLPSKDFDKFLFLMDRYKSVISTNAKAIEVLRALSINEFSRLDERCSIIDSLLGKIKPEEDRHRFNAILLISELNNSDNFENVSTMIEVFLEAKLENWCSKELVRRMNKLKTLKCQTEIHSFVLPLFRIMKSNKLRLIVLRLFILFDNKYIEIISFLKALKILESDGILSNSKICLLETINDIKDEYLINLIPELTKILGGIEEDDFNVATIQIEKLLSRNDNLKLPVSFDKLNEYSLAFLDKSVLKLSPSEVDQYKILLEPYYNIINLKDSNNCFLAIEELTKISENKLQTVMLFVDWFVQRIPQISLRVLRENYERDLLFIISVIHEMVNLLSENHSLNHRSSQTKLLSYETNLSEEESNLALNNLSLIIESNDLERRGNLLLDHQTSRKKEVTSKEIIGDIYKLLADNYFYANEVKFNLSKFCLFYQVAISFDNPSAKIDFALLLEEGYGIEQSHVKAISLLESASQSSSGNDKSRALRHLGRMHALQGNTEKGIELLLQSNEPSSLFSIGAIYYCFLKDHTNAIRYYEQALALLKDATEFFKVLSIRGFPIRGEGLDIILNYITMDTAHIYLDFNQISNKGLQIVCEKFSSSTEVLSLVGNAINDDGIKYFIQFLNKFEKLNYLSFRSNQISFEGALLLLIQIKKTNNKRRKHIDLQNNLLDEQQTSLLLRFAELSELTLIIMDSSVVESKKWFHEQIPIEILQLLKENAEFDEELKLILIDIYHDGMAEYPLNSDETIENEMSWILRLSEINYKRIPRYSFERVCSYCISHYSVIPERNISKFISIMKGGSSINGGDKYFALGVLYEQSKPSNFVEAMKCYKLAAYGDHSEGYHSEACYRVGLFLEGGLGCEKDPSKSLDWFLLAIKLGSIAAQRHVDSIEDPVLLQLLQDKQSSLHLLDNNKLRLFIFGLVFN